MAGEENDRFRKLTDASWVNRDDRHLSMAGDFQSLDTHA